MELIMQIVQTARDRFSKGSKVMVTGHDLLAAMSCVDRETPPENVPCGGCTSFRHDTDSHFAAATDYRPLVQQAAVLFVPSRAGPARGGSVT
ncbi:hypothetical protein ACOMHN_005237 [Nucella lapillus]